MPQKLDVSVGMKFKKTDTPQYVLEIFELYTPEGECQHARTRVSIARHDLGVRLYSISALADKRLFTLLDDPAHQPN